MTEENESAEIKANEPPHDEAAEAKAKGGDYVEFRPPKGFMPPEHDSDEFDLVCSFRVKPDGRICMTKLGDHEMPVKKEKEKAPDYKGLGQSIVSGTDQMMAQSNQSGY